MCQLRNPEKIHLKIYLMIIYQTILSAYIAA